MEEYTVGKITQLTKDNNVSGVHVEPTVVKVFNEGYYIISDLRDSELWDFGDIPERIVTQQSPELIREALHLMFIKGRLCEIESRFNTEQNSLKEFNRIIEDDIKKVADRTRRINLTPVWCGSLANNGLQKTPKDGE